MREKLEARMYRSMNRYTDGDSLSLSPLRQLVIEQAYLRDRATLHWWDECQRVASGLRVLSALDGVETLRQEKRPVFMRLLPTRAGRDCEAFKARLDEITDGCGIDGEAIPLDQWGRPLVAMPEYHRF